MECVLSDYKLPILLSCNTKTKIYITLIAPILLIVAHIYLRRNSGFLMIIFLGKYSISDNPSHTEFRKEENWESVVYFILLQTEYARKSGTYARGINIGQKIRIY